MSTELVMPSNHLILCRPILLLSSIFPSIRVFSFSRKREEKLTQGPTAWFTLEDVTLSEISQSQKDKYSLALSSPAETCAGVWGLILRVWVPAHSPNQGKQPLRQDLLEEPCAPA